MRRTMHNSAANFLWWCSMQNGGVVWQGATEGLSSQACFSSFSQSHHPGTYLSPCTERYRTVTGAPITHQISSLASFFFIYYLQLSPLYCLSWTCLSIPVGQTERDNCMSYVGHYQEGRFITRNSQIPERLTVDKSYENVFYNLTKNITMTLENVKLIFKQTGI